MNPEKSAFSHPTRSTLDEIMAVMRQAHGLDVTAYDESFLAKSFEKRRLATASETAAIYLQRLSGDPAEAKIFFRSLTIPYSEFFRDPLVFALLEQVILPRLLTEKEASGRAELRMWSAGCATGQEAWSVAILLDEWTTARGKPLAYRIFATDRSEANLARARSGVYGAAALGNVRLRQLERYFSRQGEFYTITARLRGLVDFSVYDLLDRNSSSPPASIYGDFDLVICSNVLLYYRPQMQRFILDKLRRNLAIGGYLVSGEAERQIVENAGGLGAVAPHVSIFQSTPRRR